MKFGNIKSVSPLEIVLFVAFVVYIVFPISTPDVLTNVVDTPLGIITLFIITLCLFVYTNPILGIMYIFVAYEVLRRSTKKLPVKYFPNSTTQSESTKTSDMVRMNPPRATSLEEEMVQQMAPVGHSDQSVYIESAYKPVSENTKNAATV